MNKLVLFILFPVLFFFSHQSNAMFMTATLITTAQEVIKKVNANKVDKLYQNLLSCNSQSTAEKLIDSANKNLLNTCITKIATSYNKQQ